MRRKTCLSVSLIAAACMGTVAAPPGADAQSGFGTRPTAGIYAGPSFPRGALDDETGIGWHGGAFAKIRLYGPLDARIDGTYAKFGNKDIVRTAGTLTTHGTVVFGTLGGQLNLGADSAAYPGDNTVSPYLLAGVGKYQLDYDATCTAGACAPDPGVRTHWGISIGGGATVPLAGLRTFLEARYHRISRDIQEDGARVMVLVSAGIKFR